MASAVISRRLALGAIAALCVGARARDDDKGAKTKKPKSAAPKPGDGAVQLVGDLYKAHMPFVENKGPAIYAQKAARGRFLSPELIALIERAEEEERRNRVPVWNADPLTDSQDPQIRDLKVTLESADATSAMVLVRFEQHRAPTALRLRLLRGKMGWRVDDVFGGRGDVRWTLRTLLAPTR